MAQGLSGLSGIAGYQVQIDRDAQASPEQRSGGIADPRHGVKGEQAKPYSWESKATQAAGTVHGPFGPENQMLGDESWFFEPAGNEWQDPDFDHTPSTGAAPWPKGINSGPVPGETPDAIAEQLRQSYLIHGVRNGAGNRALHGLAPLQDEWNEVWEVNPGASDQSTIPRQMMSSGFNWGTRDRVQSMARQNEHGFDSKHMHRRFASGPIPGNTFWMRPGGRPLAKSLPGPGRPAIGKMSPFEGDNLGAAFSPNGAVLQNVPSEYAAPPTPQLTSAVVADVNNSVVEWY